MSFITIFSWEKHRYILYKYTPNHLETFCEGEFSKFRGMKYDAELRRSNGLAATEDNDEVESLLFSYIIHNNFEKVRRYGYELFGSDDLDEIVAAYYRDREKAFNPDDHFWVCWDNKKKVFMFPDDDDE